VLVGKHNRFCKLSDFGMSKQKKYSIQLEEDLKVPVRWISPESLRYGVYSEQSDIWSIGVMLFEIFTDGSIPYEAIKSNDEVRKMILKNKVKLIDCIHQHFGVPAAIVTMIDKCMQRDAHERITLPQLQKEIEFLINAFNE
jgi:serine/threonine protein kinase